MAFNISGSAAKNLGRWYTHSIDPEDGKPIRVRIRRVSPEVDRQLTVKHGLNKVRRTGRKTQALDVAGAAGFRVDKAQRSVTGIELRLRAEDEDAAQAINAALGGKAAIAAGDIVDLEQTTSPDLLSWLLARELDFAGWILEQADEQGLQENEAEEKKEPA